jgi:hypothetical protein
MNHHRAVAALALLAAAGRAPADDVEPRRWTPLPIGTTVVGVGVIRGRGDVGFDPVLKVEDATVKVTTTVVSLLRAFDLFGKSARVDVRLPQQHAHWQGLLDGEPRTVDRRGLADPSVRLAVDFSGAPALSGKAFNAYRAAHPVNTVVGAALTLSLPLGEYQEDKLLNLGTNRFAIQPQLGVVHTRGPWSYELTGSVAFFTDNNHFLVNQTHLPPTLCNLLISLWQLHGYKCANPLILLDRRGKMGQTRRQDPVLLLQAHTVYTAPRGWWVSLGAAYDWGGRSTVEGVVKDDYREDLLYGISAGLAINRQLSVQIAYVANRTQTMVGSDTDNVALGVSVRF